MSGSHLSKELFDLIKSIGEARSKQEEDKIISSEAHSLVDKFKEKSIPDKKMKEYLIRAIYVELLGHDANFAHIAAINMSQSKSLKLKRLAYLACTLFLTEKSNAAILLVATLQKDLLSKVDLEVEAALVTLCKIANVSILEAIMEPVYKLLNHKSSRIKKKAVMVVHKFYQLNPALIDDIDKKMKHALCDKDPCVMAASLNYFHTVIKANPNRYKDLVASFVVILKQVIEHRLPKEYDFHRMPAPWIQMKLLAILGYLGQYDQVASEGMYEVLNMTIKRADDLGINIGYAIVYQCLKTIITIYPYKSLIELAATTISRFLNTDNKNLKYVGITGLAIIVSVNPEFVLQHQASIVECLEDPDETLKSKTIDLLYRMTNYKNVSAIVEKFLSYLRTAHPDSPLRKELVIKINQLAERFATNKTWFINTVNRLFEISGDLITPDITNSFIRLISDWEEDAEAASFRKYAIELYLNIMKNSAVISDPLMEVMTFVLGFYGPMVFTDEKEIIEVIKLLIKWVDYPFNNERTTGLILNAVMKLHRAISYKEIPEITSLISKYKKSKNSELAQRASEHSRFIARPTLEIDKLLTLTEEPEVNLSFLTKYTDSKSSARYDETKSFSRMKNKDDSLNFQPYNVPSVPQVKRGEHVYSNAEAQVESQKLIVNVPRVIGEKGYIEGKIPATTVNPGTVPKSGIKSFSGNKNAFNYTEFPQTGKEPVIKKGDSGSKKSPSKIEQANTAEKNVLFAGIGEMAGTPIFEPAPSNLAAPNIQPTGAIAELPKKKNLLDLDEEEKSEKKAADFAGLEKAFNQTKISGPAPANQIKPLKIDMDDFGQKWVSYQATVTTSIPAKSGFGVKEVVDKISTLGFCEVSLLENEGILAGTIEDSIILLHFIFAEGNISFTMKTSKPVAESEKILNSITSTIH